MPIDEEVLEHSSISQESKLPPEPAKLWRNEYQFDLSCFFIDEVEFDGWVMPGVHLGRGEWRSQQIAETKAQELLAPEKEFPCPFCGGIHETVGVRWLRAVPA